MTAVVDGPKTSNNQSISFLQIRLATDESIRCLNIHSVNGYRMQDYKVGMIYVDILNYSD